MGAGGPEQPMGPMRPYFVVDLWGLLWTEHSGRVDVQPVNAQKINRERSRANTAPRRLDSFGCSGSYALLLRSLC